MNINEALFNQLSSNLKKNCNSSLFCPITKHSDIQFLNVNLCNKLIMEFYNCPNKSQKTPDKILNTIFNLALIARYIYELEEPEQQKNLNLAFNFVMNIDIWEVNRWLENNESKFTDPEKIKDIRENAIGETLYLTHQMEITIGDDCPLRDMLTVAYALFEFAASLKTVY